MHRKEQARTHLASRAVPLAVVVLLLAIGTLVPLGAGGVLGSSPAGVTHNGNWTISTPVSYGNTSLFVNGSISIVSGGSLSLNNVTLILSEPSALAHSITIGSGGALSTNGSTIESATPTNHLGIRADAGATVSISGGAILDVGGAAGPLGFVVDASSARFSGVAFQNYYEALVISATDVTVDHCVFSHTTSTTSATYVVSTSGSSAGFVMTHSRIVDTAMAGGGLFVASSSDIENNTFTLNPQGTNPRPILIGYAGSNGHVNASGTRFIHNVVSGSDVTDFDSSHVTISHNQILNTGGQQYVHDFGVHAEVFTPSGAGIWINGLTIEYNYISNSTGYGIRVEQNVTNAVIAYNTITNISTDPVSGPYNGAKTYCAIYLIRGVTHTLVTGNLINASSDIGNASLEIAGIGLESEVSNSTVSNNTVLNTDLGLWVQGDWNDGSGNIGPSWFNTITGNTFRNTRPIVQTHDLANAIQSYDWSNRTTISNNIIQGWNMVPSGVSTYEGAAILQADPYGTISGNVVKSATYGVVFGYFYGQVSNASYNALYGNSFNVTKAAVVDNTASAPAPIQNVVNVLTASATSSGFPTALEQSIGGLSGAAFSEAAGAYATTLETPSPITGAVRNYTTSIPWKVANFSVAISGPLGRGTLPASVSAVSSTQVTYAVSATGALGYAVSLAPTTQSYTANYTVRVVSASGTQSFSVYSPSGPAYFQTSATGNLSITVVLDSWTPTTSPSTIDLELHVARSSGTPVADVTAQIALQEPGQATSVSLGPTNSSGDASLGGLPSGTSVTNVSITAGNYTVGRFTENSSQPGVLQLDVVVVPVAPLVNSTVELVLTTATVNGTAVSGLDARVELTATNGTTSVTVGPTNSTGEAIAEGIPAGATVQNVTVSGGNYTVQGFAENTTQPGILRVSVVVAEEPVGANNSTTFQIRFTEHGLGSGAAWRLSVSGPESLNVTSAATNVTFYLPNGTYRYSASAVDAGNLTEINGSFVIPTDAYLSISVNFPLSKSPPSPPGTSAPGPSPAPAAISLVELIGLYFAAVALGGALVFVSRHLWRTLRERRSAAVPPAEKPGPNRPRGP